MEYLKSQCMENISTHALTEGDIFFFHHSDNHIISTHALTEGDALINRPVSLLLHFNSRPHGGRLAFCDFSSSVFSFQLTPSRRATMQKFDTVRIAIFQLTPSRRATFEIYAVMAALEFQLTPSRRATANLDKFFF